MQSTERRIGRLGDVNYLRYLKMFPHGRMSQF